MKKILGFALMGLISMNTYASESCTCALSKAIIHKILSCGEPVLDCHVQARSAEIINGERVWPYHNTYMIECNSGTYWLDCNTGDEVSWVYAPVVGGGDS